MASRWRQAIAVAGGGRGIIGGEFHCVIYTSTAMIESMDDEKVRLRQMLLSLVRGVDTHVSAIRDLVQQNFDGTRDPNDPMNNVFAQIEEIAEELDHLAIQCHEIVQQQYELPSFSSAVDPDEKIPADYSSSVLSVNLYNVDSCDSA